MNELDRYVDSTIFHIDLWNNSASEVISKIENNLSKGIDVEKTLYLLSNQKFFNYFQGKFNQYLEVKVAA